MAPTSAIPTFYYVLFGIYEPILTVTGFLGAIADPKKVCTADEGYWEIY